MSAPRQTKQINNLLLKAVAVVFALFLWFYVDAQQNPLAEQRFDVPINYINLASDLSASGGNKTVAVSVKGRQDRIGNLRSSDFDATVDMSQVVMGSNQLQVKVTSPADVETATVKPTKIEVMIDRTTEMNMEVRATILGNTEEGYTRFAPSIQPTTVLIRGPESVLKTIAAAKVEVDVSGAKGNIILNLPVKLLTEDGIIVDNSSVDITPQTVEVFMPVDQETPSKMVPIKPNLVGQPAEGHSIARVVTEPETVKIVGRYDDIATVDQLQTLPIHISNITADLVQEVEVVIPNGVTLMSNNTIKVLVSVAEKTMVHTVEIPIVIRGDGDLEATLSQATAQVNIETVGNDYEQQLSNIIPYISISGLEAGVHEVEVKLEDNSGLQVLQLLPATIEVTLSEKPAEPLTP